MDFLGEPAVSRGVVERRFDIKCEDRLVPGLLWTPEDAHGPRPLVLIGHGGSGNKRMPYVLSLARRLVRHLGWATCAIDGPGHGDRDGATLSTNAPAAGRGIPSSFLGEMGQAAEAMTADWTATFTALRELDEVGDGPLGYWGLSMGTMFGIPFVAATPEVRVAVLGLMGTFEPTMPWSAGAAAVTCPVLFLLQGDDELVPPERAFELFRSLGSTDKRLHAHPGAHSAVPTEEVEASEAFLARHLV
jgi:pimeloyl-ACP methyl ester carboxylesterase